MAQNLFFIGILNQNFWPMSRMGILSAFEINIYTKRLSTKRIPFHFNSKCICIFHKLNDNNIKIKENEIWQTQNELFGVINFQILMRMNWTSKREEIDLKWYRKIEWPNFIKQFPIENVSTFKWIPFFVQEMAIVCTKTFVRS